MKVVRLSMITLSSPPLNDLLVRKKPAQLFLSKMELSASDNDSDWKILDCHLFEINLLEKNSLRV